MTNKVDTMRTCGVCGGELVGPITWNLSDDNPIMICRNCDKTISEILSDPAFLKWLVENEMALLPFKSWKLGLPGLDVI